MELTVSQIAKRLGVTPRMVQHWIAAKILPARKVPLGERYIYLVEIAAADAMKKRNKKRGKPKEE